MASARNTGKTARVPFGANRRSSSLSEQLTPTEPAAYRLTLRDHIRGAIWGFSEPFRRDRTAAWASVLALLLAVAPGFTERYQKGRWGDYDPTIAVLTATLIALIWTAHYTFRAVRHAPPGRRAREYAAVVCQIVHGSWCDGRARIPEGVAHSNARTNRSARGSLPRASATSPRIVAR